MEELAIDLVLARDYHAPYSITTGEIMADQQQKNYVKESINVLIMDIFLIVVIGGGMIMGSM